MLHVNRRTALGLGIGVASVGLFGAVAMAALAPEEGPATSAVVGPLTSAAVEGARGDKLKALLDGLVQKGVITQQQEDTILATARGAVAANPKVQAVLRDFIGASAQYLGVSEKTLRAKLPGTTLAAVAAATSGKDPAGLVAAVTTAANADIDKALSGKKITEDQAAKLRSDLGARVGAFVDRTWPAKPTAPSVTASNVRGFLGDLLRAGQAYLGVAPADVRAQLGTGKSLGDIANATNGKSRDGLVAALTAAANARVDEAAANKKLTPEQAATLKAKIAHEVATFVDRKATTRPRSTTKP